MERNELLLLAADGVLLVHALLVLFVVAGLCLVIAGGLLHWPWVRNPVFRLVHLAAIGIVVIQSWVGVVCPLTTWEMDLRRAAGEAGYEGTFVSHWVGELLYYQAPPWVFVVAYTTFGALVIVSWFRVPPRPLRSPDA